MSKRVTNEEIMNLLTSINETMKGFDARITALENGKGAKASAPKELVEFKKADGTVVRCTQAQADAWTKWRDGAPERKAQFDAMKADWSKKKAAYKPSKELIAAIKTNRAAITRTVAKEQYGFIGSKEDLKALKDSICK